MNKPQQNPAQQSEQPHHIKYYFAAINEQRGKITLNAVPVSPNFRTRQEAEEFINKFHVKGACLIAAAFCADSAEQADEIEADVFSTREAAE